jgi:hypothetical protein
MKHLRRFNEDWKFDSTKKADFELSLDVANDILPKLEKMRKEGQIITTSWFENWMEEKGSSFELCQSVINELVDMGFNFDPETED